MRLRPTRLATQFTLLLLASLLLANLIAALLMAREGSEYDRAVRLEGDMGRLVALVGAIEEADPVTGDILAEQTSTGFTRFSLTPEPLDWEGAIPAPALTATVSRALPGHAVRVHDGSRAEEAHARRILMVLSVQMQIGAHRGEWLNAIIYPLPELTAWHWKRGFFIPLALSFATVLGAGLLFVRHMTRPLRRLAIAVRAAGTGDRNARVTETGAQELRAAAAAFNDMQRRIADFDRERAQLVAALGHDLRTPITGLRIRAEMIDDDATRADMVRILDQMTVMADDLLHFSGGLHESEPLQDTDLGALLSCLCHERHIPFSGDVPVQLRLRPVAITRAVGNLIDNALRYAGQARVSLSATRSDAIVTVTDDGPGIPPDRLEALRAPFTRGEQSRSDRTGGVGLGLSIAEGIARDHRGRLDLANRPEGGLRARLILPRTPA